MPSLETITVLGAGTMGSALADLAQGAGYVVNLQDVRSQALEGSHPEIRTTTSLSDAVAEADLVLECVPEDLSTKQDVLSDTEDGAPSHTVLASNTSSIPITWIGEGLDEPARIVGMHFFHPVDRMDLVEIVPAEATSEATLDAAEQTSHRLGKDTVALSKDPPGFATTRLIVAMSLAAMRAQEAGLASHEGIDAAMTGFGFPMGPFQVTDYSGLDVLLSSARFLHEHLGDAYEPPRWLEEMVAEGRHGAKTGSGFYDWDEGIPQPDPGQEEPFRAELLMAVVANEASTLVDEEVAVARAIDQAARKGLGFPVGPLEWAREEGTDQVIDALGTLHGTTGDPLAKPRPALQKGRLGL